MKTFMKLQGRASKETPFQHFGTIVSTVRRILGTPTTPSSAASFHSPDEFARGYLSHSLTRKAVREDIMSEAERLKLGVLSDLEREYSLISDAQTARARVAFTTREDLNSSINREETWGYDWHTGTFHSDGSVGHNILLEARDIIADILGQCDIAEVCSYANFGNGASASLKRSEAQREKKYLASLTGSRGILPFAAIAVSGSPVWSDIISPKGCIYVNSSGKVLIPPGLLKESQGAVLDFVPKDAEVHRVILKEPELNGYFQKGLGVVFRKRLRAYRISDAVMLDGIDLNTSGSLNSELAQAGSEQGHIGTVDGKQASDSWTVSAVEFLLPPDWFKLVMSLRSSHVQTPWGRRRIEMVGGMGNGFTFELESILFYAIGVAAARRSKYPFAEYYVSIHGDDLTIPSDVINEVTMAYARAYVVVNSEKSFTTGPFRESCGGHFFNGSSVKPFYVKKQTGRLRGDWFWLANSLLMWLSERTEDFLYSHRGVDLLQVVLHLRQYSSNSNARVWTVGVERSRRSGLFGLAPYKLRRGWPLSRTVTEVKTEDELPDGGKYLAWLQRPTRLPSVLDLCRHTSDSDPTYYSVIEGEEKERWTRLTTFTPLSIPYVIAPLWQLCRDHNLSDF